MLQMEINMDQDSWVIAVESSLEAEIRAEKFPDGVIHTVPKSLLSSETNVFYHPQVISLGSYHFEKKEKLDDEIELLKSGAARYVHHKIRDGLKSSEKETYVKREDGLKSVMESFKKNEERIKRSYADKAKFEVTAGEVCAWMMARDACFVLQVLQRFREVEDEDEDEKSVSTEPFDGILSRKRHHPLLTEIVKDMLKMENQLPFWTLQVIRPDIEDWFESALKNISPIEVAHVGVHRRYKKEYHILQLLHDYIVDWQESPASYHHPPDISTCLGLYLFDMILDCCLSLRTPSSDCGDECKQKELWVTLRLCIIYLIVILVFSPVILILFIIFVIVSPGLSEWEIPKHVPTAEELKRLGVKFKKLRGNKVGISHIEFNEKNSTLYLPQFKVDNRSDVILRNLIALEICSQEEVTPITRYAILMNDLINTSEDVGILRGQDIIINRLGSDEETAQLWNSVVTATEVPSYYPIDKAVSSIKNYRNKRWKVFWAQFIMIHCSKPWLVVSLLAGFILILLTFTQVICLFVPCQIGEK